MAYLPKAPCLGSGDDEESRVDAEEWAMEWSNIVFIETTRWPVVETACDKMRSW